nr:MAG TPA: tail-collar fiber protein [Caudoviricetes sp.]
MPSVYNKNRVTKKGYNLLAESIATKKPVTFTKVVIGDGDDNGLNIDTMTNVVSEKLILPVHDGQKDGDGQYLVTAVLSNSTVETGFFPKEVALFAKCGDGEEILYSYSNGGNNVGLIPDKNTPINSEIYNIRTKIGNAANITFLTSDDLYVTKSELTKHNTDPDAHGGLLQKVKTELETHNTDISSHPTITAMIAKILGATNWQENPVATLKDIKNLLGMGGIVAQRLEENGFVKFANGFTIQWGVSGEDGQYHNWIIPYSTCFFAKSEYRNPREADWNLITEYDQLKFKVWFTNDTVFKYPNIKCSVFSFGVSA